MTKGINQAVSQSVRQKKIPLNNFVLIKWKLLESISGQSDLTKTTPLSFGKIEGSFWVILLCGPRLLLGRPYYEPLLWFMIMT